MPIAISTWACAFRCGYVNTKRPKIEKHEGHCFHNPARRACKTCKHDHKGRIDDEDNDCYCELDFGKPEEECLREYDSTKITCRDNCPGWEPKS